MLFQLIILISLLLLSAFFSSTELAFVIANKLKIEVKSRKNNLAAVNALFFMNNAQYFFPTILLGNTIVNIAFASICTIYLTNLYQLNDFEILLISTGIILFFGELLPKFIARELPDRSVLLTAIPIRIIYLIFFPVVKAISLLTNLITRAENLKEENINLLFQRQNIQELVNESQKAGHVTKKESYILNKIIDLGNQRVYDAMRPRIDIIGVEVNSSIDEALEVLIESGYSKIPVYEENLDNIKGIIVAHDIFKRPQNLNEIIREVIFVPDTKRSIEMLNEFLSKRMSIAVVIDEFGGTAGIITMEDLLEELLGEIRDEYDTDDEICKKINENTFVIGGKVEIDYINENSGISLPKGDYSTLGGFITYNIGRIPLQGENIAIENYTFQILRSNQRKVELVKVFYNPETEN